MARGSILEEADPHPPGSLHSEALRWAWIGFVCVQSGRWRFFRLGTSFIESCLHQMTKEPASDRLHIDATNEELVDRWAKHMDVSRNQLLAAIEKVGTNAAEVQKQLTRIDPAKPTGA